MLITLEEYKRLLKSSFFRDCTIRSKNIFMFIREEILTDEEVEEEEARGFNPSLRHKGIITYIRNEPEFEVGNQWFVSPRSGWETITLGSALKPLNQSVSIERFPVFPSMDQRVFVTGSGPAYEDNPLTTLSDDEQKQAKGEILRGSVNRLKQLDGWLYGCGGGHTIFKRLDKGTWQSFSQHIPQLPDERNVGNTAEGFDDFDGWGENDIYAVGGRGDVWHFDGQRWAQIPFPSNIVLDCVCCGGDGRVYISGYGGETWVGRGDEWRQIEGPFTSLAFRDMVWYEGKVWCTSDYGLWVIENNRISRPDVPATVAACCGNLSVGDGVLLIAGHYGAAFKENGQWHEIIQFSTMEKLLDAQAGEA